MKAVNIHIRKEEDLPRFLNMNNFQVEDLGDEIYRIQREDELPVFLKVTDEALFFECDLGSLSGIGTEKLYFDLLNLNAEILPVSFAINGSNEEDPHLVLVESRETTDLDDHELLSVFDAIELAVDKAEQLLKTLID